ncbi:MAG: type 1 pili tip component [Gammaproteobacteria bacterium]|nr:type 1 pili tip component [Gammaproteobacteria bacterium]
MRIKELIKDWQKKAAARRTIEEYAVHLPLHDAARIHALAEMFPGRRPEDIITDLLSAALDELEGALPYVPGHRVIAEDDHNDPIYEDTGPTPRLVALARKYERELGRLKDKN